MAAITKYVKNTARTRQAARKAGIDIPNRNFETQEQPLVEQEEPDIM